MLSRREDLNGEERGRIRILCTFRHVEVIDMSEKKWSVKKTLGGVGFFAFLGIALLAVWKDPAQAASVLWPVGALVGALFGIKTFGGAMLQKNKSGKV